MKRSMKGELVLLTVLMALTIGFALGENVTAANNITPTSAMSVSASGSNSSVKDAASDAKENEAVDKSETGEDNIIVDSVTFSPKTQYVELKNNETTVQDLTGWRLDVQNKTVFTFPNFMLEGNARVKIHAGTGTDSKVDLYAKNALLTKADDEVSLLDANGMVVSASEDQGTQPDSANDA